MIITKSPDRWILESETKNDRDFLHEFLNANNCVVVHIPRMVKR